MRKRTPIDVLSLNIYTMGHITCQNVWKATFAQHFPDIAFHSVHLPEYAKTDFLGRVVRRLLTMRLPGSKPIDYDYYRLRAELANSFFARRCLQKKIRIQHPRILHIHTQGIALLAGSLCQRLPTVISIDYTTSLLAKEHPAPAHITFKPIIALEKRCFQAAAHVISCSNRGKCSVIEDYGIPERKVSHIPYGMPLGSFMNLDRQQNFSKERVHLLFVGNDFVRKGGEDVVAVYCQEFAETCQLDIVSNAPLTVPDMPYLHVHRGLQPLSPELLHLYENADVFVMPTYEDVYGVTYLEAMAAGLPCIATTVMAVPELVQNGYNGFAIAPGNRCALAQAIQKFVDNPPLRFSMGINGRKFAKREFDAITNCQKMAEIFRAL